MSVWRSSSVSADLDATRSAGSGGVTRFGGRGRREVVGDILEQLVVLDGETGGEHPVTEVEQAWIGMGLRTWPAACGMVPFLGADDLREESAAFITAVVGRRPAS